MSGDEVCPDQVPGAPHPRQTLALHGQERPERELLEAIRSDRLPHAWLIHGPQGVGKATLAYRVARFLISGGDPDADSLDVAGDNPASRRIAAYSERRLRTVRREWDRSKGRPYTRVRVEDVRALLQFFHLTSALGGWRIAVLDAAEEMNESSSNALLKMLEEPPDRAAILLVSHDPHRLLPTIRSRCRHLPLRQLGAKAFGRAVRDALPEIGESELQLLERTCDGSAGEALRTHCCGGAKLLRDLETLLGTLPRLDRTAFANFSETLQKRDAALQREIVVRVTGNTLSKLARAAANAEIERSDLLNLLKPLTGAPRQATVWAEAAFEFRKTVEESTAVNIDPATTLLVAFTNIEAAALRAEAMGR